MLEHQFVIVGVEGGGEKGAGELNSIDGRDYDKDTFSNPRMTQKPGEKWGLGPPLAERRDTSRLSPLETIIKLHKVEICSRPVARAYSSQMKEWEQFMAGVLNQVMEEIEEYRVKQQKQRIVLNSSLPYARRIDEINEE